MAGCQKTIFMEKEIILKWETPESSVSRLDQKIINKISDSEVNPFIMTDEMGNKYACFLIDKENEKEWWGEKK